MENAEIKKFKRKGLLVLVLIVLVQSMKKKAMKDLTIKPKAIM